MDNEKFYDGSFFDLENPDHRILISDAPRSFGRTSYWLNRLFKRAEKNPLKRFIYLRRGDKELEAATAKGFAKNLKFNDYYGTYYRRKGYTIRTEANNIYLQSDKDKILVGYLGSLNSIKGVDAMDVDTILFDEYVAVLRRSYKGGNNGVFEPPMLYAFMNTIFRRRKNANLILLGNQDAADSPTNPYTEYFEIPFKATKYRDTKVGLYYRKEQGQGDTGSYMSIISRINNDVYNRDVKGEAIATVDKLFITDKTPAAQYIAAVKYQSVFITLWIDINTGIMYCHDNYKVDKNKPFYTAFRDNMSIDATLLIAAQYPQLKAIKQKYFTNQIRYNNTSTASRVQNIIQVIK